MKRSVSVFILFVTIFHLNGQSTKCRVDSSYNYYYVDSVKKVHSGRTYITYNNQDLPIKSITYSKMYDSTNWESGSKDTSIYNTAGQIVENRTERWDNTNKKWLNNRKYIYYYNSNKQVVESIDYFWSVGKWYGNYKFVSTYDNTGKVSSASYFSWDYTLNTWGITDKMTYTYNTVGSITESIDSVYNSSNNEWKIGSKYIYTYDSNGREKERIIRKWIPNVFINVEKDLSSYNSVGQITEYIVLNWVNNTWENAAKESYYYTPDGCLSNFHYYFDWTNNNWVQHLEDQYVFPAQLRVFDMITLYPNPANSQLNVYMTNETPYHIIDMCGKAILSGNAKVGTNRLDISQLSSGTYIIRTKNEAQKFIIQSQ